MSDTHSHGFEFPLGDLSPQQQQQLNQLLQAESIPAHWHGATLGTDIAYEARVTTLIEHVRTSAAPAADVGGAPASDFGTAPAPAPTAAAYAAPAPSYSAPSYAGPSVGAVGAYGPPKTNGLAVASLVMGIASLVTCVLSVLGIPGLVTGLMARKRIKASNGAEAGEGLAVAGIVTSVLGILVFIGVVIWFIAVVVLVASTPSTVKFSAVGSAIR